MAHVVIQMGHCFRKAGATGTNGEQQLAQEVAANAAARLEGRGHRATIIRADDQVPRSDVFVAIHADGSESAAASGASVGWRDANGRQIAEAWKRGYQRLGWDRGFRADNYTTALARYYGTGQALRAGTPYAFIVECGFLTNPEDRARLTTAEGHSRVAQALVGAVETVLGTSQPDVVVAQFDPPLCAVSWALVPGGVVAVASDGAIFCEPPQLYKGGANGKSYFAGRRAARVEPSAAPGKLYDIVATSGERYSYPE